MNKSALAIAVAATALAQQENSAGFIEDSKATLGLRNVYYNVDNRDHAASSTPGVQSKNEEWGSRF